MKTLIIATTQAVVKLKPETYTVCPFMYSFVFFAICRHITNSQCDQFPVGLITQLQSGRALHWYCRSNGFESHSGLNLFSSFNVATLTA